MADPITIEQLGSLPRLTDFSSLQNGDGLFFAGNDWLSGLIEDVTGSIFSHVGIAAQLEGIWCVVHAFSPFVHSLPLTRVLQNWQNTGKSYPGSIAIARWNTMTPTQAVMAISVGVSQFGVAYSDMDVVKDSMREAGFPIAPESPDGKSWDCSLLFAAEYFAVGCAIPPNIKGFTAPGDCWAPAQMQPVGTLLLNP
jgi:hypothetical protein